MLVLAGAMRLGAKPNAGRGSYARSDYTGLECALESGAWNPTIVMAAFASAFFINVFQTRPVRRFSTNNKGCPLSGYAYATPSIEEFRD